MLLPLRLNLTHGSDASSVKTRNKVNVIDQANKVIHKIKTEKITKETQKELFAESTIIAELLKEEIIYLTDYLASKPKIDESIKYNLEESIEEMQGKIKEIDVIFIIFMISAFD